LGLANKGLSFLIFEGVHFLDVGSRGYLGLGFMELKNQNQPNLKRKSKPKPLSSRKINPKPNHNRSFEKS
jgi:hypothetical protein